MLNQRRPRIKICGITRMEDVDCVLRSQADAIGLNFYRKSKRFVCENAASRIAEKVQDRLSVVGVFVNAEADEIIRIAQNCSLTHVQLHGDETPELLSELRSRLDEQTGWVRAIRVDISLSSVAQQEIDRWQAAGVDCLLLDAAAAGSYGGTGHQLDWGKIGQLDISIPWLLAGGLNAQNVRAAIQLAGPSGVDVASGVESEPGIKDAACVERFATEADRALKK